jgi:hypothetical protein
MKSDFLKKTAFVILLLSLSFSGFSQQGIKSKSIKKEFAAGKDAKLKIETSYGKVHCNVWDKNLISVTVLVSVDARNDKEAEQLLGEINPIINNTGSLVDITTKIGNTGKNFKSKSFSIDYTIFMPKSTILDISNRFGDLFVDETTAQSTINIEYGNLSIKKLSNPSTEITLKFSTGNIESAGRIKLNLEYSTLSLGTTDYADVSSKFTTCNISQVSGLKLDSEYDTFTIDKVSGIDGSGKFSTFKVGELINRAELNVQYGGLEISKVNPAFTLINIIASFNSIKLGIPREASYTLNADMKFGECRYPKDARVQETEKSYTSKMYSGTVGTSKNPVAKVNIQGKNSDVTLY